MTMNDNRMTILQLKALSGALGDLRLTINLIC